MSVTAQPPIMQTQDYRVIVVRVKSDHSLSGEELRYAIVNRVTGVVEAMSYKLPEVLTFCPVLQQGLDDARTGKDDPGKVLFKTPQDFTVN